MSYRAVREGLAANLRTLDGVQVHASPPDTIVPPAVVVGAIKRDGRTALPLHQKLVVDVLMFVSRKHTDQWQLLDDMCDPESPLSVQAAIEADGSLDGAASDSQVVEVEQAGAVEVDGVSHYGAVATVEVLT